ncbi:bifunctional metallophosphatase/5'-nucleotidase [Oceanobacillus halophilus]|uniref:Bifunctional metallophosphatase/5'-nucleotidase n=1 Tax=Oceanobacillus halophilus TaxID=930130 RepID=A0A494ZW97_9BACI|nr:bifunctional UDP-sugar hydrolase/5'-nucleotidase [Oceanobacillus halophilus]RKQ30914.1 bifunctional metallophosphatase/5'-nucleotidase [Oceanobacillus halophilus]
MPKDKATITVLYTSDVHGNAMPVIYGTNEPADLGLAKYATAVKQIRENNEHVLVIDNGDLIQGTPLMTHYVKEHNRRENPMIAIMNKINIDAGVIGNHEFNFGKKVLTDAVQQSNYPWLAANILDKETKTPYFGPPYMMKTLSNGIKVAIVGVTTHYIPNWESPNHIEGLQFADAFTSLQKWVPYIRETENPDVLIVSYHGGLERDIETGEPTENLTGENQGYQMCEEIEGIDILLTGHQHRKLVSEINNVLVIQPGNNCLNYGEVQISLEKEKSKWNLTHKVGHLHSLDNTDSDTEILDYMKDVEDSTQKWLDQPTGYIKGDMTIKDPFKARLKKHPFIQLIQEVQMNASGVDISVTSLLNNESTGFNSVVTMRDIVSNYMYPNTLVVLELTGKDIKAALEKSAAYFILDPNGELNVNPSYITPKPQHYNYDMWEGINYTINVRQPIGSRVESIFYHGEPLKDEASYHVVLNNYRASGGGNYDMFKNKPIVKEIQKDAVELIREYFEKHQTVHATVIDNFVVKS